MVGTTAYPPHNNPQNSAVTHTLKIQNSGVRNHFLVVDRHPSTTLKPRTPLGYPLGIVVSVSPNYPPKNPEKIHKIQFDMLNVLVHLPCPYLSCGPIRVHLKSISHPILT
jgi:hypothetical protein